MFEPPTDYNINSYYYKYKEMLMEKNEELLDNLIFYTFEGQSAIDRQIKESEIITIEKEDIDKFINFNYKKLRKGKEYILKKLEENKFDYKKSKEALGLK